jgi:hypothetical protein
MSRHSAHTATHTHLSIVGSGGQRSSTAWPTAKRMSGLVFVATYISFITWERKILLSMSTDDALTQELLEKLEGRFGRIKHDNGDNLSFLGLNIKKEKNGVITISQPAFVEDILDGWDIKEVATTPATRELLKADESSPPVESKIFLSHVMKLIYVATKTRPDILFAVSYLASRSSHPTLHDLKCVERIKAYLNGTRNYGLKVDVEDMTLQASVDASHGIHPEDSKGHTGMVLSLSNSPVFSRSVKQKCVATSSTHAEILAAYESVSYIVSLRQLLEELNYPQPIARSCSLEED